MRTMRCSEFVRRLGEQAGQADRHYVFWLGAGCSVTSGIPAAASLVRDHWLPRLFRLRGATGDLDAWLRESFPGYRSDDPAGLYGRVMNELFPLADERQRETERLCDGRVPGFGYAVLACLMSRKDGILSAAVTTNFDDLVADAMYVYGDRKPLVIQHGALAGFVRPGRVRRPLLVKVHGDHRLSPMHTSEETSTLDEGVAHGIRGLLHDRGVIFVGYAGNDRGVIEALSALPESALPLGAWWVSRDEPRGAIRDWLLSRRAVWVCADGFDELMLLFREEFGIEHPTAKRFERMIDGYRATYESLTASVQERPDSAIDSAALKEATKQADAAASDWWGVALAAGRFRVSDPDRADAIYREGIESIDDPRLLVAYARFLKNIRNENDRAQEIYERAITAHPDSPVALGNYAFFLKSVRKDHGRARELYERAIAADPNDANSLGNLAGLLLESEDDERVLALIDRAFDNASRADGGLFCELWFYLLAAGQSEDRAGALGALRNLVGAGARSPGWDFSGVIERARRENRPDVEWLEKLADVIAERAEPEILQGWGAWSDG
jgi:tetratricopeptide (TPR) repeat protein